MRKVFRDLFTGKDGETFDLGRVLWAKAMVVFAGLSAFALWRGGVFDPMAWAGGAGALLAAGGGALWAKRDTEPGAK